MFGLSIIKKKDLEEIKETMTHYQRSLEDIGWINLSLSQQSTDLNLMVKDGFEKMIKRVRLYYYNNPLAGHWVHLTTSFVFGEGIGVPKAKDEAIQEIVDAFWNDPDNQKALTSFQAQQLLSNKIQYEGNLFFVLFDDEEGDVRVRVLNTVEIKDIIMDEEDRMRPAFYKIHVQKKKFDFKAGTYTTTVNQIKYHADIDAPPEANIPPNLLLDGKILHIKINCDINDQFGIPNLYRAIDWMKAHKDMAGDLATFIKSLSRFAWKKKVKGGPAKVASIADSLKTRTDLSNISSSAGQMQIENEGVDLQAINLPTGGAKIGTDGLKQMQLQVCAASGIFHHYFGDPSTGNLATAKSMELPMVKMFQAWQKLWESIFTTVLQYQFKRKIALGLLEGTIELDPKTGREIIETSLDMSLDLDFPPIIEENLKEVAEAINKAKEGGLISEELAAQLFLLAANVDNIEDEVQKALADLEAKRERDEAKFQRETDIKKLALNKPEGSVPTKSAPTKKTPPKKTTVASKIREVIEMPDKNTGRNLERLERKNNFLSQRMNAYRKSLNTIYTKFRKDISESVKVREVEGRGAVGIVNNLDLHVDNLGIRMIEAAGKFFPEAIEIGKRFALAEMKELGVSYNVDFFQEAFGEAEGVLNDRLQWNSDFVQNSLVPDVYDKLEKITKQQHDTIVGFKESVMNAVDSFESRMALYVGAYWTVEETAVKEAAKGSGLMANYAGPIDELNSPGCRNAAINNPYPIDEVPIPGSFESGARCRHAIQLIKPEGA